MNVNVTVTVGNYVCECTVTETDMLALGDILNHVAIHILALLGADVCIAVAQSIVPTMEET